MKGLKHVFELAAALGATSPFIRISVWNKSTPPSWRVLLDCEQGLVDVLEYAAEPEEALEGIRIVLTKRLESKVSHHEAEAARYRAPLQTSTGNNGGNGQ